MLAVEQHRLDQREPVSLGEVAEVAAARAQLGLAHVGGGVLQHQPLASVEEVRAAERVGVKAHRLGVVQARDRLRSQQRRQQQLRHHDDDRKQAEREQAGERVGEHRHGAERHHRERHRRVG